MHDDVHWRWFPGMSQEAQIVVGSPNGLPTDLPKVNPTLHQCRHAEAAPAAMPQHRIWADGVAIDTLSRPHNHNASLVKKYFSERMGLQMKLFLDTKETGINSSMQETNSTICKIFLSRDANHKPFFNQSQPINPKKRHSIMCHN